MAFFTRRGVSVPELPADILQQDDGEDLSSSSCNSPTKPVDPSSSAEPSTSSANSKGCQFSYDDVDRTYGVEV